MRASYAALRAVRWAVRQAMRMTGVMSGATRMRSHGAISATGLRRENSHGILRASV